MIAQGVNEAEEVRDKNGQLVDPLDLIECW